MARTKLSWEFSFFSSLLILLIIGRVVFADTPEPGLIPQDKPTTAEIRKVIGQLGSSDFTERETASKRLQEIGKPALDDLRKAAAASNDPELRRRAKEVIGIIATESSEWAWEALLKQGIRMETTKKDYKKAVKTLTKAEKIAKEKLHPDQRAPEADIPILTEIYLHLARSYRGLESWGKAGNAFSRATYYSNYDSEKRKQIDREWSEMTDELVSGWEKIVKAKIAGDTELKKLAEKYPLVVLHSRRFAGGGYLKSAYSFKYETTQEEKHGNDVDVLFDNGAGEKTFQINMFVGQKNRVLDLGAVDFAKDPDPNKLGTKEMNAWQKDSCKAVHGHMYLEKVEDDRRNEFFVVFQIVAVDKDSNYMAFFWRRLPGGKITKDR